MTVRSGWSRSSSLLLFRSRKGLSSLSELNVFSVSASYAAAPKSTTFIGDSPKRYLGTCYSDFVRQYTTTLSICSRGKGMLEANGKEVLGAQHIHEHAARTMLLFQPVTVQGACATNKCFVRSFASKASNKETKNEGQTRKEVSTIEDPFDAPTYNIPEKPVTFTEGASYSIVILAGLGVAVAAGYAVFKELIFEPKEYKVFNKALKRIQDDSQVRVRIGSPITGYGQESRNRAARQRIANKVFTDEDGVEHVQIGFYIRGPHGAGKVAAEMFKDNADKQWKYTYLIVQITQPSHSQLILESYMPAPPVPA